MDKFNVQKLIYGIGAFIALFVVIGFALPRSNRVEVTTEIDAHAATVFALVNDFRRFAHWSPWVDTDPNARFLYSGASRGVGAIMTWDGSIIGRGTRVITASRPYKYVGIALNPRESGTVNSWFSLSADDGTTIVTWGFEADYGFKLLERYFASIFSSVVARDHQRGLTRLKELAESLPSADFGDLNIEHFVVEADEIAYLSTTSRPDPDAIAEAMGEAYFQILSFIDEHDLSDNGAPLSITRNFSGSALAFDAAIPVRGLSDDTPREGAGVKIGKTYSGPVIRVRHTGSYERLADTHRKIVSYLAALGIQRNGAAWESYVSDPGNVAEKDLLTYIYYPTSLN